MRRPCCFTDLRRTRKTKTGQVVCATCGYKPGPAFLAERYRKALLTIALLSRGEDAAIFQAATQALVVKALPRLQDA